jgi:glutamate racemase
MSVSPARPPAQDAIEEQGQGWRIGVFDSGVGGLSVLRAVRARLPQASLVYVADSGYAPYGERDQAFITARCHHIAGFLRQREVDCIIVACNTATAIAVNSLRADLPDLPIIGVEPGVKPAVAHSPGKRVGVLATPGTLASERFQALVESHGQGAQLTLQACPGLHGANVRGLVAQFCKPLLQAQVDTVVLGCTHYPFVADTFSQVLGPGVAIIDTAHAVARRTASVLHDLPASSRRPGHAPAPVVELWTSGPVAQLSDLAERWLGLNCQASPLP